MKYPFALLAAVALSLPVCAQTAWTPPTPEVMAQHQVIRYSTILSLTSEQQSQATTLFTEEATSGKTLRTSERTAHEALETAIKSGDTAAIQEAATTLGQLNGQQIALRATTQAKFYAMLTADQKTKYAALEHGHRGGPGGSGGPGGGPGGPPPADE
jgi:Spy/CpxP family protein refolding chaperone